MSEVHTEDKKHQRMVKKLVCDLIKNGYPPRQISISGLQNPDLENWAKGEGIIFDAKQEIDLIFLGQK